MSVRRRLQDVYDRLPVIECKGLCFESCSIIACTPAEADIMERRSGKILTFDPDTLRCTHLTDDNRCAVYKDRPLVCRLYGGVDALQCGHDCRVTHPVTKEQEQALVERVFEIGGPLTISAPLKKRY